MYGFLYDIMIFGNGMTPTVLNGGNKMDSEKIIEAIAEREGVSAKSVERDIKAAIREGMRSDEQSAKEFWSQVSPNGEEPDIGTLLKCIAEELIKQ